MGNDIRLATLVALLASWSATPAAQPLKEEPQTLAPTVKTMAAVESLPEFGALDADGDNNVSEGEAINHPGLAALFAELDKNHDGRLSAREYAEAKIKLKEEQGRG